MMAQRRIHPLPFNGHSFDLPVLRYRAMVNRVPGGGLQTRSTSTATPKMPSTFAMGSALTDRA
jgi:predicted PolB exonuclease-like 3'-5' exonuclease